MALGDFQRAFADLAASPERCLEARENPDVALGSYDLTGVERRRLAAMVREPAMSVNCTLYRVNRLTPIYSVLPLTCFFLADRLASELSLFWTSFDDATLQYGKEAWRFGKWVLARIAAGDVPKGPVEDAIRFELAAFAVRTAPRVPDAKDEYRNGRKQLVRFVYEPSAVLDPSTGETLVPTERGEWVLLDATGESLEVHRLKFSAGTTVVKETDSVDTQTEYVLRRS
jgi:hypothetical protein